MKQRLLMITIELPYPANSGGRMKSWNMLKALSQSYEVGLVSPLKYGSDLLTTFNEEISLTEFHYQAVEIPRNALNLAKSYVKAAPLNVYRSHSTELKKKVAKIASDYDIILLDHYESFQYLPENYLGQVILHTHNATYLMWERYANTGSSFAMRSACAVEARRVKSYERKAVNRADLVFASPNDIEHLVAIGGDRTKFRETYHLGDDSQLSLPQLNFCDTDETLLYVGTLSWEANIDGLIWFLKNVWPEVKSANPKLKFKIAGGNPDPRILAECENHTDVQLLGFVDDLEPLFRESRLFMAPLLFGSGIKVKVLNAMCRGLPTITTPVGAEGLAVIDMKHLSICSTADQMIMSIDQLLKNQTSWELLRDESRALIEAQYTWKKVLGYMIEQIDQLESISVFKREAV